MSDAHTRVQRDGLSSAVPEDGGVRIALTSFGRTSKLYNTRPCPPFVMHAWPNDPMLSLTPYG